MSLEVILTLLYLEIKDEQTNREKKIFPKNNIDKDKTKCSSPMHDLPNGQFSDYLDHNDHNDSKVDSKLSTEDSKNNDKSYINKSTK